MRSNCICSLAAMTAILCACGSSPNGTGPLATNSAGDSGASENGGGSDDSGGSETSGSPSASGGSTGSPSGSSGGGPIDSSGPDAGESDSSADASGPAVGGGPCDIYQSAGTPCVAAHSTVRALYASYNKALYQVRRASDNATKDIPVLAPGGFADTSVQGSFCSSTTCTISILYDQSGQGNDLTKAPPGATWLPKGGNESSATAGEIKATGHTVYGIYVTGDGSDVAYRNNSTKGLAHNDDPEAMYMVLDAKRYSGICCFDYGNAETNNIDDGPKTMEALYWGSSVQFTGGGAGHGPWVAADLENGIFYGGGNPSNPTPSNTAITGVSYVTAMLKGPSGNHMTLKAGDAQGGMLAVKWDGSRPPGYTPMLKQGAIILGSGGDGSNSGTGTFFEGAITSGNPPDAADDAVQANVVAAGYGR